MNEDIYMVVIPKPDGRLTFVCSGKNSTPFATTNIGRARAMATYTGQNAVAIKATGFVEVTSNEQ